MSPFTKTYFIDKFFHVVITILLTVCGFIASQYIFLSQRIFNKLVELTESQGRQMELLKSNDQKQDVMISSMESQVKDLRMECYDQEKEISCVKELINKFH